MTILVDMDDVLELLSTHWIDVLNKRFGTSLTREDMTEFKTELLFPGHTRDEVYAPLFETGFWYDIKPMPGAIDAIETLIHNKHDIYVVTSSYYQTIHEKMDGIMSKYFPSLSWGHVIVTSHKELVMGDVLIDDNPDNLLAGLGTNPCLKVLFDAPWNRSFNESLYGFLRVHNWDEAMELINSIDKPFRSGVGVKIRKEK